MSQMIVGAAGDSTNACTTLPIIEKSIDTLSRRNSIVGGLGMDTMGKEQLVQTKELAGQKYDVGNSSCIQSKAIDVGDEARFSLQDDFKGRGTHGAIAVKQGQYPTFYHDTVRLNMFDSPEFPFWSEMDQQRFANLISNLDENYQKNIAHYMAEWTDFMFLQSAFHGADEGLLLTADEGGLGMQLLNATGAGETLSCKNTWTYDNGMVTWNATRATFEAAIGTEIYDLTDTTNDGFGLTQHDVILNQVLSTLRFKTAEAFGMQLRAVAIADPWVVKRILLRSSNNTWYTLMRDADTRGPKNHAIDRDQSVVIDGVLYIPCDWMRAFRATGSDGVKPTYGAALDTDPKVAIDTADTDSKKCAVIYCGAKAFYHAFSRKVYGAGTSNKKGGKVWFTPRFGDHGKGGGWAAHTKIGFRRREMETKDDGTTAYLNNSTFMAWFYDPGPGVGFAA